MNTDILLSFKFAPKLWHWLWPLTHILLVGGGNILFWQFKDGTIEMTLTCENRTLCTQKDKVFLWWQLTKLLGQPVMIVTLVVLPIHHSGPAISCLFNFIFWISKTFKCQISLKRTQMSQLYMHVYCIYFHCTKCNTENHYRESLTHLSSKAVDNCMVIT